MQPKVAYKTWREHKREALKDPAVRKAYEALALEYEIASALIGARLKKGLTQQQLAEALNTKQSVISRAESADTLPSLVFLRRVADALDCSVQIQLKPKKKES